MQVLSRTNQQFLFPRELIKSHSFEKVPFDFQDRLLHDAEKEATDVVAHQPTLYTAKLTGILDWLHGLKNPGILEEKPCITPLLLYEEGLCLDRVLLHYEGNPQSAQLIRRFVALFDLALRKSSVTIISPSFIPKSKLKEEQDLIQMVNTVASETSFIKFNFSRIGDFWSYAVKHEYTLLVTTKNYQADLAKILFHFYKGGMWYDKLSFYLS